MYDSNDFNPVAALAGFTGGNEGLSLALNVSMNSVSSWRVKGRIPPAYYLSIKRLIERRRLPIILDESWFAWHEPTGD